VGASPILLSFEVSGTGKKSLPVAIGADSSASASKKLTNTEAILASLQKRDSQTSGELAESTGMTNQTIYDYVFQMKKRGLIEKFGNVWMLKNGHKESSNDGRSVRQKILDYLATQKKPLMPRQIGVGSGVSNKNVNNRLFVMVKDKDVRRTGSGYLINENGGK